MFQMLKTHKRRLKYESRLFIDCWAKKRAYWSLLTRAVIGAGMSTIALVDDDRNILTSVSMTLEAEGFDVETYNDGQSALDAFNRRIPDMAVLDIKMPRMDGMELLQRLR